MQVLTQCVDEGDQIGAGLPIDGFGAQIASMCNVHQAALATRNAKDFQDTGIDVIDPWQPEPHTSPAPDL